MRPRALNSNGACGPTAVTVPTAARGRRAGAVREGGEAAGKKTAVKWEGSPAVGGKEGAECGASGLGGNRLHTRVVWGSAGKMAARGEAGAAACCYPALRTSTGAQPGETW